MQKEYKTAWFLEDRSNIDKSIYDIMTNAMASTRAFKNKQLFFQYFAFLYFSGRRRIEPFMDDVFIKRFMEGDMKMVKIISVNAKHFIKPKFFCLKCNAITNSRAAIKQHLIEQNHYTKGEKSYIIKGKRKPHIQIFRIWNAYEQSLIDFLLQGRTEISISFLPLLPKRFQVLSKEDREKILLAQSNEKETYLISITSKFKMFRARITNGRKGLDGWILPHMLRHMRAYNLLINKHIRSEIVQRLLGWNRKEMVDYYADIKNTLGEQEMIEIYRSMG